MGFYLKKSINLGGLRINFSNSGVGFSTGVTGFRIGSGPRGTYVHMGRGGLYYRKTLGKRQNALEPGNQAAQRNNEEGLEFREIESASTEQLTDSSSQELIEEINAKQERWPFWPFFLLLLPFGQYFTLAGITGAFLMYFLRDRNRKKTLLMYDIEDDTEGTIQRFYDALSELGKCSQLLHISEEAATGAQKKYHAGRNMVFHCSQISLGFGAPDAIKTNVTVPSLPVGKQTLYFFPDKLFICEKNKIAALAYDSLRLTCTNQKVISDGQRPDDATLVGSTWKYLNTSGGPDKRFKDNRELPIYLYSEISFQSDTGLHEKIQASKKEIAKTFKDAFTAYIQSGVAVAQKKGSGKHAEKKDE